MKLEFIIKTIGDMHNNTRYYGLYIGDKDASYLYEKLTDRLDTSIKKAELLVKMLPCSKLHVDNINTNLNTIIKGETNERINGPKLLAQW